MRVVLPRSHGPGFEQKDISLHDCLQQGRLSAFPATEQCRTALHALMGALFTSEHCPVGGGGGATLTKGNIIFTSEGTVFIAE